MSTRAEAAFAAQLPSHTSTIRADGLLDQYPIKQVRMATQRGNNVARITIEVPGYVWRGPKYISYDLIEAAIAEALMAEINKLGTFGVVALMPLGIEFTLLDATCQANGDDLCYIRASIPFYLPELARRQGDKS